MSLIKKKDSAQGIEPLNDIQKNVPLLKKNSLKILCHYKIINEEDLSSDYDYSRVNL